MSDVLIVLTTFGDEESAKEVGRALVERKLVACVNLVPGARSVYEWEGEVREEGEVVVLMKTTCEVYPDLERVLKQLHPYEEPEVVALGVRMGSQGFLDFVKRGVVLGDKQRRTLKKHE
ncbi:MAG: divalent-cation tolerance protein CutA [Verrucomicrobiota bacterium]